MKEDVKITQDLRLMQTIVKEVVSQHPDSGINIVNIGQIQITSNVQPEEPPSQDKKTELLSYSHDPLAVEKLDKAVNLNLKMTGPSEIFNELRKIAANEARTVAAQVLFFVSEGIKKYYDEH